MVVSQTWLTDTWMFPAGCVNVCVFDVRGEVFLGRVPASCPAHPASCSGGCRSLFVRDVFELLLLNSCALQTIMADHQQPFSAVVQGNCALSCCSETRCKLEHRRQDFGALSSDSSQARLPEPIE